MGIVANVDAGGKEFEPITEMIQAGVIADIMDKGIVTVTYPGAPEKKVRKATVVWLLAEEDAEGRQKRAFQTFTVSLHEKSSLRKFLKSLGYKDEQFPRGGSFDLDTIIGTARMLVMSEEDGKDGGKYVRVTAVTALKKGQTAPVIPADFVRKQDKAK